MKADERADNEERRGDGYNWLQDHEGVDPNDDMGPNPFGNYILINSFFSFRALRMIY